MKNAIRNSRLWDAILPIRAKKFEKAYRSRRDRYARILDERGEEYSLEATINKIHFRLADRGYHPVQKTIGQLRTFSIIGEFSWHGDLLYGLKPLGEVYNCDYQKYELDNCPKHEIASRREQFSKFVLEEFQREHAKRPFDWVFAYINGRHILKDVIEEIQKRFGVPMVNMCLDDKNSWELESIAGQNIGQIDLANTFDLSWTSASVACRWYLAEGGRPIFLPEGCTPDIYTSTVEKYDMPVSFMGASYGCRPTVLRHLRRHGIQLSVFGRGWGKHGQFAKSPVDIFSRSQINFGIGGIAFSESLTNLKGRDFDIPCTGGGVYLTTFNPDLAQFFDIGTEILCYQNLEEAVEMIQYYSKRPDECRLIADCAKERCLKEHSWQHRFIKCAEILGIC